MKKIVLVASSVYGFILTSLFVLFAVAVGVHLVVLLFLLPMAVYFLLDGLFAIPYLSFLFRKRRYRFPYRACGIYAGLLSVTIFVANVISVRQLIHIAFVLVLLPVVTHFVIRMWSLYREREQLLVALPHLMHHAVTGTNQVGPAPQIVEASLQKVAEEDAVAEEKRRTFLKMVAGAGAGVFLTSILNPSKASAAFFGSVPGPGVISVKDSGGTKIDPAIKSPTDGFGIANVDNANYPAYCGFINKEGGWYILQENPANTFQYATGGSSYATNWTNRAALSYGSFDSTF